jgi:aconitate hydratase
VGRPGPAKLEIPFKPARVVLQDFHRRAGVVDLAAMRSAMKRLGGDPKKINPLIPVDLVIDHSVQVDASARPTRCKRTSNRVRAEPRAVRVPSLGPEGVRNFRVVPPNVGIVHQVNLEYLAKGVFLRTTRRGRSPCPTRWSAPTATRR